MTWGARARSVQAATRDPAQARLPDAHAAQMPTRSASASVSGWRWCSQTSSQRWAPRPLLAHKCDPPCAMPVPSDHCLCPRTQVDVPTVMRKFAVGRGEIQNLQARRASPALRITRCSPRCCCHAAAARVELRLPTCCAACLPPGYKPRHVWPAQPRPQDKAARFASMVAAFCERLGWYDLEALIVKFQVRGSRQQQADRQAADLVAGWARTGSGSSCTARLSVSGCLSLLHASICAVAAS